MDDDTIIKGGRIVDGSGNPWYKGDIAVTGDEIVCIARNLVPEAEQVIDATGLVVAPGFIDAHSHADSSTLFYREMESVVAQGITTVVAVQCGSSIAPVNPDTVVDTATYQEPHQLPKGIEHVMVNGEITVQSSEPLGTLAGRTLRKNVGYA